MCSCLATGPCSAPWVFHLDGQAPKCLQRHNPSPRYPRPDRLLSSGCCHRLPAVRTPGASGFRQRIQAPFGNTADNQVAAGPIDQSVVRPSSYGCIRNSHMCGGSLILQSPQAESAAPGKGGHWRRQSAHPLGNRMVLVARHQPTQFQRFCLGFSPCRGI